MRKDDVYTDRRRTKIDLEFLEESVSKVCFNVKLYSLKWNSKLIATTESATTADGEADVFTTTNETAPSRYSL